MFKKLLLVMGVAFGLTLSVTSHAKQLLIATDISGVPFTVKEGNSLSGFDVQLWDAIAKKLNLDYKLQAMDFSGVIPGLQTGNVDGAIAAISINDKRKRVLDFSDPYYDAGLAIMTRVGDVNKYKTVEDLKHAKISAKTGTVAVDYLKRHGLKNNVMLFPNSDNVYLSLKNGLVDVVVDDTPSLRYFVRIAGEGKVTVSAELTTDDQFGIAFPKGSKLTAQVNRALKELKADGTYQKIYDRWFGEYQQ